MKALKKRIRFGQLYAIYGGLLTEKQQKIMEEYFYDDLSLGEIAENTRTSRQAVYDLLRRVEQTLEKVRKSGSTCCTRIRNGSSGCGEP